MNRKQLAGTARLLLEHFKLDEREFLLKEQFHRFRSDDVYNVPDFVQELFHFSSALDVSFLEETFPEDKFLVVLQDLSLPLLVFLKKPGESLPLLCLPDNQTKHAYCLINPDGSKSMFTLEQLKTWSKDFYRDEKSGYIYALSIYDSTSILGAASPDEHHATPWQRLVKLMLAEKNEIGYIYLYAIVTGLLSLSLPLGIQAIVSFISGGVIFNSVTLLITFVLLGVILTGALQVMQLNMVELLQRRMFTRISLEFAVKIPRFKFGSVGKVFLPEVLNRFFDTPALMKAMPKLLIDLTANVVTVMFGLILLSFYHPFFVFYGLLVIALLLISFRLLGKKGLYTSIKESKKKYEIAGWLQDLSRNYMTFRTLPSFNIAMDKTDRLLNDYLSARKKHYAVLVSHYVALIVFKTLILGGLLIIGAQLVINREISLGQFIASELVIVLILGAIEKLVSTMDVIYDALTSIDKIGHISDIPVDELPEMNGVQIREVRLQLKNLRTSHVAPLSLVLEPGEKIGIIGLSKLQRLELLNTLEGEIRPISGHVMYGNINLLDADRLSIRNKIHKVTDAHLVEGTLEENISLGLNTVSYKNMYDAVVESGLEKALAGLPARLNTVLDPGNAFFSPELRSRIIYARMLALGAQLWLVDDFLGDNDTRVMAELSEKIFNQSASILYFSNNPFILRNCDRVLIYKEDGSTQWTTGKNWTNLLNF